MSCSEQFYCTCRDGYAYCVQWINLAPLCGSILRRISMSSLTNIQSILNAITESAAKICDAYDALILLQEGDALVVRAHYGPIPVDFDKILIGRDSVSGRAFVDRRCRVSHHAFLIEYTLSSGPALTEGARQRRSATISNPAAYTASDSRDGRPLRPGSRQMDPLGVEGSVAPLSRRVRIVTMTPDPGIREADPNRNNVTPTNHSHDAITVSTTL
jgi:hypothetical protein